MNETVERFHEFFHEFQRTDLWKAMKNTHENSPWHREDSVATHTRMLISWYEHNILPQGRHEEQIMLSLIGCLFHDVGKPSAEEIKHSEERGDYRAYHGHELISARLWDDYAMTNLAFVEEMTSFSLGDIANVSLMIEHHVPFGLKDKTKRQNLKTAFLRRMGEDGHQAWIDMLLSDQNGRISDDQPIKLAAVDEWLSEWSKV